MWRQRRVLPLTLDSVVTQSCPRDLAFPCLSFLMCKIGLIIAVPYIMLACDEGHVTNTGKNVL